MTKVQVSNPELEEAQRTLALLQDSPAWEYVRTMVQEALDEDVRLLIAGTEKDDQVRGGIAMSRDLLALPDRLRERIAELEQEENA